MKKMIYAAFAVMFFCFFNLAYAGGGDVASDVGGGNSGTSSSGSISSSGGSGGGGSYGGVEISTAELTNEQYDQLVETMKPNINRLDAFIVPLGVDPDQIGFYNAAKYKFQVEVVNRAYKAEFQQIEVGDYEAYVFGNISNGGWAFEHKKIPLKVVAGQTSKLTVRLKLTYAYVPFRLPVTSGSFVEGRYYDLTIQRDGTTLNINGWSSAQYRGGNLYFNFGFREPFHAGGQTTVSITDMSGTVFSYSFTVNLLEFIATNGQPITVTPNVTQTGNVVADIGFVKRSRTSDLFQPYTAVATVGYPKAVAIGDLIGKNDIVMAVGDSNGASNKLIIYSANRVLTYDLTGYPNAVAIGDINKKDGKNDIIVSIQGQQKLEVFYQGDNGSFTSQLHSVDESLALKTSDVNDDGWKEIISITQDSRIVTVYSWKNYGDWVDSGIWWYYTPMSGYKDFQIADVNGDGQKDIVLLASSQVMVMQQKDYSFSSAVYQKFTIDSANCIAVGDIDGDGKSEIVISSGGNRPSAFISLLKMADDGNIVKLASWPTYDIPWSVKVADVNGDGKKDIAVIHAGWNKVGVYLQKNDGSFGDEQLYDIPNASTYSPDSLAIGDINNDGKADLVVADYNHGLVTLLGK